MEYSLAAMLCERTLRLFAVLGVTFLVARHLGVETFGLLSTAQAIVALTGPLVVLGLDQVGVRNMVVRTDRWSVQLGTIALLQFAGGVFATLFCVAAAWLSRAAMPGLFPFLVVLALVRLLQWPAVGEYVLRALGRNPVIAAGRLVATLGYLILAVLLLRMDAPAIAFAWLIVADIGLLAFAQLCFLLFAGEIFRLKVSRPQAASLLRETWPLVLSGFAAMAYMRVDQIMLASMLGEEAAGIYAAAARISEAWYVLPTTVAYVFGPMLLKRADAWSPEYLQALFGVTRRLLLPTILVAVAMSFGAGSLVTIIYGPAYAASGPVLALHFWSAPFVTLGVLQSVWLVATGQTRIGLSRTLFGAIVNIALNLVFIPRYGAIGAAISTLAAQICATFLVNSIHMRTRQFFLMQARTLCFFSVNPTLTAANFKGH